MTPPSPGSGDTAAKACTKDAPSTRASFHPDAVDVGEEYNGLAGGGDYDIKRCPHCGKRIYVELPD